MGAARLPERPGPGAHAAQPGPPAQQVSRPLPEGRCHWAPPPQGLGRRGPGDSLRFTRSSTAPAVAWLFDTSPFPVPGHPPRLPRELGVRPGFRSRLCHLPRGTRTSSPVNADPPQTASPSPGDCASEWMSPAVSPLARFAFKPLVHRTHILMRVWGTG